MIKSELYSNLKNVVELLYSTLHVENAKAVSHQSPEEEMELLQYEIGNLNYSYLDEIYNTGLDEVVNEKLSPVENALISSVGLLDEYGLSDEEFKEWLEKQDETYRPLLNMLVSARIADGDLEKLKAAFAEKSRQQMFDPKKIDVAPKNGMRFAEESTEDGSKAFYYLQKLLVFDKEFDDYNRAVHELESIFKDALEEYQKKQADALSQQGACGEHFYETLLALAQAFKEAQDNILRAMTGKLRGWKAEPDAIQKFRWKYRELTQEACTNFIHLFEHMVEGYDQYYPQKEAYRHEYIDYISALRAGRRDVDIALSDYSSAEKDALHVANQVATSAANQFANSFMDTLRASSEQIAFATKLKRVFESDEYKEAIDEIFYEFEDAVGMEYAEVLEIKTYGQDGAPLEENVCKTLGEEVLNNRMNKSTAAEFLKTYTLQHPYNAKIYATAYLCFGGGAGDVDKITKYLGIYESFMECVKETCVPVLKNQMNLAMAGENIKKLEEDIQFAESVVKKYPLISGYFTEDIREMRKRFGIAEYTTSHSSEELQEFNKILYDESMLGWDDTYNDPGHLQRKGMRYFEKKYKTYESLIDQSVYGPIMAFYAPYKDTAGAYLAFTPEKLFYLVSKEEAVPFDYFEVEVGIEECKLGTYTCKIGSPKLMEELGTRQSTKRIRAILTGMETITEENLPEEEIKPEFVEMLKILKNGFIFA